MKAEQIFAVQREWANYDLFDQESIGFYLGLGENLRQECFPAAEGESLFVVGVEILLEIGFPDCKSIAAADGHGCLFWKAETFCLWLSGRVKRRCRARGVLGVIRYWLKLPFFVLNLLAKS